MTIIQQVRDVLEANAGMAMTTAEIEGNLTGVKRDQINGALWRLRTEDDHVKQVRTGVHKYLGPSERMPKLAATLEKTKGVFAADHETSTQVGDSKYFTQVGFAKNGDLLITRDSDGAAYRATPL